MSAEHLHARQLLQIIRARVSREEPPIRGYSTAAEAIGLDGDTYARHMGQVTSRIDAASFISGWPMLALHFVRKPSGEINPESFADEWSCWKDEIVKYACSHPWSVQQVDEVIGALDGLPKAAAVRIWEGYSKRERVKPGFVSYNLHRKLRC